MYKNTQKPSVKIVNENGETSNVLPFNENGSVAQTAKADARRIDHLKLAINKGDYTINPLRVAEKFIQFENQLSV
jgi:anti-sigma28 factor (negative regulator of flagellin synthesis)